MAATDGGSFEFRVGVSVALCHFVIVLRLINFPALRVVRRHELARSMVLVLEQVVDEFHVDIVIDSLPAGAFVLATGAAGSVRFGVCATGFGSVFTVACGFFGSITAC